MTTKKKNAAAVALGRRGGKAGTGQSKRRDQDDPDYYKRISAKAAKARKRNRQLREQNA